MNKNKKKLIIIVAVVVAFLVGIGMFALSQLSGDDPTDGPEQDKDVTQQANALPETLKTSVLNDLALKPVEYLKQVKIATSLNTEAKKVAEQSPDKYAGASIDDKGNATIFTTGLLDTKNLPKWINIKEVDSNLSKLQENLNNLLNQWMVSLSPENFDAIKSISIDFENNKVNVNLAEGAGSNLPSVNNKAELNFVPEKDETTTDKKNTDTNKSGSVKATNTKNQEKKTDLKPGDIFSFRVKVGSETKYIECTLGFGVRDPEGNISALTAGHCKRSAEKNKSEDANAPKLIDFDNKLNVNETIGQWKDVKYSTPDDFGVLKIVQNLASVFKPSEIRSGDKTPVKVTGVADPVQGMPVCKKGADDKWKCGRITSVFSSFTGAESTKDGKKPMINGFNTNICMEFGDSGAPIVSGHLAVGLAMKQVDNGTGKKCGDGNGTSQNGGSAYSVKSALKNLPGYQLVTSK